MSRRAAVAAAVLAFLAACSDGGGSQEAFCATARRFAVDNPGAVFDQYDPADPAEAARLLRASAQRLRDWASDAPGEVDGDVDTIAEAAEDLADAFEAPDPRPEDTAELEARFSEVEAASARVTAYARENCGVELDPAGAPVTTLPGSPASSTSTTAVP